jgi:hypothetical protein
MVDHSIRHVIDIPHYVNIGIFGLVLEQAVGKVCQRKKTVIWFVSLFY